MSADPRPDSGSRWLFRTPSWQVLLGLELLLNLLAFRRKSQVVWRVGNSLARTQIDRDAVVRRLRVGRVTCGVIFDAQLLRVNDQSQVAVVQVVVVLERHGIVGS